MPTALERSGDFSQTFDGNTPINRLIFIRDPQLSGSLQQRERRAGVFRGEQNPRQPY